MSTEPTILVVDDEPAIRQLLRAELSSAGYRVAEAMTATEALDAVGRECPALILLDLGLPDRDGLELIPLLHERTGIVVISARDATEQKVEALDLGADDYISKPFDSAEVLARVRTALRHRARSDVSAAPIGYDGLEIDLAMRIVRRSGAEVHLTPKEFGFLEELARNAGRVVTHAQLLRAVWGPGHEQDVEYLRVAARAIRRKLEVDPASPRLLRNEPGIGYRLMLQA
ncbi:response regulator [Novosphingobium sp. 9]|uniref:response regulator n=1 Tax=Novosphingobium sp. 9 TaxID=2025349 RepID=UPI0021B52861|nr:response regulator transcription factor [Novosphingobium sp. 9]